MIDSLIFDVLVNMHSSYSYLV